MSMPVQGTPPGDPSQQPTPPLPPDPTGGFPHWTPPAPPAPPAPSGRVFTEEEVNQRLGQVRTEEHNKLYPQLEEQRRQLAEFERRQKEWEDAVAAQQAQADQEAQRQREEEQRRQREELDAKGQLAAYQSESEQRFAQLNQELARERALREQEAHFARVTEYRARRLQEEADNIAPQLVQYVQGATVEEVDASIARAVETTNQIMAQVAEAQGQQPRSTPLAMTGAPSIDPQTLAGQGQETLTSEQIRNMSPQEYMANRDKILAAASQEVRQRGPYGW